MGRCPAKHAAVHIFPQHPSVEITRGPSRRPRVVARVDEVGSGLKGLNPSTTPRECREQGQRNSRFSDAAMSTGDDQSRVAIHGISERHVKVDSHASEH